MKALDIHEANLTGAASLDPLPLNPPSQPDQGQSNPLSLSDIGALKPEIFVASGGLNQARRVIDEAVALFVCDHYLFSKQLMLVEWDFYLAATVLLEKVRLCCVFYKALGIILLVCRTVRS